MSDTPSENKPVPQNLNDSIYAANDGNGNATFMIRDTLGVIMLGIIAIMLLIALLKSQARVRELLALQRHPSTGKENIV